MVSLSKVEMVRVRNYIIVGGSAFLIEYSVFIFLDKTLQVSLLAAQSISFLSGLVISFLGSRYVTFASRQGRNSHKRHVQILSFLGLGLFNLVASNGIIYILVINLSLPSVFAKILVMGFIVIWNYLIFSRLIFKQG